jgi:hypothetical protein
VLAPADMVLHSATHLFYNEEFSHGLRDLFDVHCLLCHFSSDAEFWETLTARARELDLLAPLYYALRYTSRILDTPVPQDAIRRAASGAPPLLTRTLMDALWLRVLRPDHPSATDALTSFAQRALYLRAHWLRMPPTLLAYHLAAKALRRKEAAQA